MSKRKAYFSDGTILKCDCGRSAFKRHVRVHFQYADEPLKVWFRPCKAWEDSVQKSLDAWARRHGFVSYEAYQFIKSILKGEKHEEQKES